MSTYRFCESAGTREIVCAIHPAPTSELNAFRLRQAWEASGFETCLVHADRIEPALREAMSALASAARHSPVATAPPVPSADGGAPSAEGTDSQPLHTFVIAERRDANAEVAVSDDGMNAELSVLVAQGGRALDDAMLRAALDAAGVRFGTDETQLAQVLADAAAATPGSTLRRMIAQGRRPARGVPSRFENLVVPFQDRVLKPQEREDGSVDFHDLGAIDTVAAGDALVRRHPAHAGESGMSVLGAEIPSEVPAETAFVLGDGTEIDPADPDLLRATRTGVPHRIANGMSVNDVLEVAAVDLHTGNVEFDGSLLVKGDVHPDMRVRVSKDLFVGGFIESADIEAGGDVTAKKGVIGPAAISATHSCRVKARNIRTHYVQHAELEASEDIVLETNLVNSRVSGCRDLRVGGGRSRNARIIGGEIHATGSVSAAIIGSETGVPVRIVFDDEILRLRAESDGQRAHRVHVQETAVALEKSLKELAQKPRTTAITEMLTRVANTIRAYHEELEQLEAGDIERRQRVADLIAACQVTATVRIHAGVELVCLDARHRFGSDRGPGTLGVRDGNWTGLDDKPAG